MFTSSHNNLITLNGVALVGLRQYTVQVFYVKKRGHM